MSNLNTIEINKVCRTCLVAAEDMKSLYDASSTAKQICLAELLMSCTPLKCRETDGLPTTICRNCVTQLNQCDTFQRKCLASEATLRNHVTGEPNIIGKPNTNNADTENTRLLNCPLSNGQLNTPIELLTKIGKDYPALDLVKIEIDDYKINSTPSISPHETTDVSAVFRNLSNKTSTILKPLDQEYGLVKREQDTDEEKRTFEEVIVNTECPLRLENPNLISVHQSKSLKDPLTITEISEAMNQRLDLIKHEIDFQIKTEKDDINIELSKSQINKAIDANLIDCDGNKSGSSGKKPYACTICIKTFTSKTFLTSHLQNHLNEKPFLCSICNKTFGKKYILNMHLRTHTGEKPYTCQICKDTFRQSQHLKLHNLHMHTEEKPYPCTVCDKSFKQKQQFTYHMRKHTGEKPYPCTGCSMSFGQPQSLKIHMRSHTGEKPYPCTVCDSSFKQKSQFRYHMRSHTGEKPYSCTFCDMSFNTKQHLTSHMRTHTGEKPYSCTVCEMTFGHNHNLKLHMRTHTGEKPYTCSVCNNSYRQKQYFKTHMRSHT